MNEIEDKLSNQNAMVSQVVPSRIRPQTDPGLSATEMSMLQN